MNIQETNFVRFVLWLEDYWPQLLVSIGTVLMGAGATSQNSSAWIELGFYKSNLLFFAGALLLIFGNIFVWRRSPGIKSLQIRVSELEDIIEKSTNDYFDLFEQHLSILANDKLGLGDDERISVYKYEGDTFVMLGRYSKNPEYCKRGRGQYPADSGIIAMAWQNGEAFISGLPDPCEEEKNIWI